MPPQNFPALELNPDLGLDFDLEFGEEEPSTAYTGGFRAGYSDRIDFGDEFSGGYSRGSPRVDPTREYWARNGNPQSFIANLESKVEEFRNYQRSSAYWRWLIKNWQYYSNLYFDDQIDSIGV